MSSNFAPRLADQITGTLDGLKEVYAKLTSIQGEALLDSARLGKHANLLEIERMSSNLEPSLCRDFGVELKEHFSACTKLDIALNNFVVRSKPHD